MRRLVVRWGIAKLIMPFGCAAMLLIYAGAAWASLEHEMQGLFNTMTNITDGGYHKGMGRGVVSGPSLVMRNRRVRTDLFNFVPPSIDAGCGGIDMFLGSFSFIDADQLINLLQAIATNAAGYAFKLALTTMCPTCEQAIESLQKAIQKLNAMAGDSCRLAQGAVDYLADQLDLGGLAKNMEDGPISSLARAVGSAADDFSAYLDKINKGSATSGLSESEINALLGNAAWKVLKKNNYVSSAFIFGDNELAEALMSVTGTVIGVKGGGDDDAPVIHEFMPLLTVKDIMMGASPDTGLKPKRYQCLNSDCTQMSQVDYDFKGLDRMVKEILLGEDLTASGEDSFVFKLIYNSGSLSEQEKRLIRVAPYHMTRLRNIAVCSGQGNMGSLPTYAEKASRLIALEVLERYLKDAIASISQVAQGNGVDINGVNVSEALIPKFRAKIKEINDGLRQEQNQLAANLTTDLEQIYQSATKNCNLKPLYVVDPFAKQ